MGETSLLYHLRAGLANAIAPRPLIPQREIWPYGDGSYSGYRLMLARAMPELRLDPFGLALAAETSVWAKACIDLRKSAVGRMPWFILDAAGNELKNTPFHAMLTYARLTYQQNIFALWEQSLSVHGETYFEKLHNEMMPGFTVAGGLRVLNAIAIDPQIQNGEIVYYQYSASGGRYRLELTDVFTHRYSSLTDDFRAVAPMTTAMDAVGVKRNMQNFMRGWFDNGSTPGGIVTPKAGVLANDKWAARIMDLWATATKGANNANSTIFIPELIDYMQYDSKMPEHQQELSDDQIAEICAAFRVPVDMVKPGGNKDPLGGGGKMDSVRVMFYEDFTEPECDDLETYINDILIPWLMPRSGAKFAWDFDQIRSLIKDTKERSDKVRAEFNDGAITFNEMRVALDYETLPGGDVFKFAPGTVLVGKDALATAPALLAPPPPPVAPPPAPALPAPIENKDTLQIPAVVPQAVPDTKSAAVMLHLGNHPDLIALQNNTRKYMGMSPVQWSDPAKFHVTVATMPMITDEQVESIKAALNDIPVPELSLKVGSLAAFHKVGEHAVHFKVRSNKALDDYQEEIYQKAIELGIPVSGYSVPDEYKPHITMGYSQDKITPAAYYSGLAIKPTELHLGVGDEVVYKKPVGDVITPEPPPEEKKPEDEEKKPVKALQPEQITDDRIMPIIELGLDADNGGFGMDSGELMEFVLRTLIRMGLLDQEPPVGNPFQERIYALIEQAYAKHNSKNTPPKKTYVDSVLDELGQWEKKVKNKGVKAAFVNYLIRDEVAGYLRDNLILADGNPAAIKATFEEIKTRLSVKAINQTQSAFEDEFNDLLAKALNDEASRRTWAASLRYLLNKYSKLAFADGLTDGGLDSDEMDDEDKDALAAHLAEQSQYVTGLGDAIYKREEVDDKLAQQKSIMWWNKSCYGAYQAGLVSADKNGLYLWRYGDSEHCDSCIKMNDQRHRLKDYHRKGILPKADSLECKGFNCACELVRVSGKSQGNWLGAVKAEDVHEHTPAEAENVVK